MNVQGLKCFVGLKLKNLFKLGKELLKYEFLMNLLFEFFFGKSFVQYELFYEKGYIDEMFSFDFIVEYGFGFVVIGGDILEFD